MTFLAERGSGDLEITYVHLAPQVTYVFDRYFVRADFGLARVSGESEGLGFFGVRSDIKRTPSFGMGLEVGASYAAGRSVGQLGVGLWDTWLRHDEDGDFTAFQDRGHLLTVGMNLSFILRGPRRAPRART